MILFVSQDRITNEYCNLRWDAFGFLTGSKLDLSKRIGKQINVIRDKGHLYFYDAEFLLGEHYKYNGEDYKCCYINNNTALLMREMKTITLSLDKASNYRIA